MPGPAPSVYSPLERCGIPQANSITSIPRWISPRESASTLPCSDESICASSSMCFSTSDLKLNITRARRCGLIADHSGKAASAALTATRISARLANGAFACTSPVAGSNTSPKRPDEPFTCFPAMKCVSSFMGGDLIFGTRENRPASARVLAQRLHDFFGHLLRIGEQHHRVVAEEQLVLDARVTGTHAALDEQHRLGFLHIEDRHAENRRLRIGLGGWIG